MTGQMNAAKGCMDLLSAATLVKDRTPELRFLINSKSNGSYLEELKTFVKRNNLQDVVAFSPWRDNVDDFYRDIDVFVLPSRHHEGYGLVVAEAMARRLPIVATKSGGVVEIV